MARGVPIPAAWSSRAAATAMPAWMGTEKSTHRVRSRYRGAGVFPSRMPASSAWVRPCSSSRSRAVVRGVMTCLPPQAFVRPGPRAPLPGPRNGVDA